jgi:diguanylate cyclase (GGDEF)-like protein
MPLRSTSPLAPVRGLIDRYGRDMAVAFVAALLMVTLQLGGFLTMRHQRDVKAGVDAEAMRIVELNRGLNEAQDALHRFADTGTTGSLDAFYTSLKEAETARAEMLGVGLRTPQEREWYEQHVATLTGTWRRAIDLHRSGDPAEAVRLLASRETDANLRAIRGTNRRVMAEDKLKSDAIAANLWFTNSVLFWLQIGFAALMLISLGQSVAKTRAEARARANATDSEARARRRLELLFKMNDMLQSAEDHRDANAILVATATQLAPQLGGALYIFSNSGDRLHLATTWNITDADAAKIPPTIMPADCWGLKRGKPHLNLVGEGHLQCPHAVGAPVSILELPMVARGQVLGMLMLGDPAGEFALEEAQLIGSALADGMSLALANIALRERLRNQALRDGLTGLYNRRYMEDTLERFVEVSKGAGPGTSLVMIDLDHFKSINDEHGHAAGDAVLRDVGAILMSTLRKADVACRYGGEELAVILPSCEMAVAVERAKQLCARIEALSDTYGFRVSASMGVASAPVHARSADELVVVADKALYVAKANGRNQVRHAGEETAAGRRGAKGLQDKLAAAV